MTCRPPPFFVYDWPANGQLVIPGLANKPLQGVPARWPAGRSQFTAANNSRHHQPARRRAGPDGLGRRARHPGRAQDRQARSLRRRDPGPARRPHEMVARRPLRHVHPLGRLFRPRRHLQRQADQGHRRVDHEQRQDPRRRIPRLRQGVQPGEVQRRRMGAHGQGRRHEIHRHHLQAPRRLRHVRLEGLRLEHRQGHALRPRPAEGTGRRLPEIRPQARLLLFPGAGLEQRRLRRRRQVGPGPGARAWTITSTRSPCRR